MLPRRACSGTCSALVRHLSLCVIYLETTVFERGSSLLNKILACIFITNLLNNLASPGSFDDYALPVCK